MSQPINRYKADLRDFRFVLFEQFKLDELLGKGPFANWGKEEVETVIDEVYAWSTKVLGPLNAVGDAEGCKLVNGQVVTPPGFKEAWKSLVQAGWRTLAVAEEHGGQSAPFTLASVADEIMCGANIAFNMYPGLI
jgi:alkylation response protein AidB-like acyl-CoA dehydrogenase